MVNPLKIESLIRSLQANLDNLRQIANVDQAEFESEERNIAAVKYFLQIAIQSCIDIGNHIISSENLRSPADYRDTFTIIQEAGIIPADLEKRFTQMVGLRNRLVHLYWEIDNQQIYQFIKNDLGDFEIFIRYILAYIKGNS